MSFHGLANVQNIKSLKGHNPMLHDWLGTRDETNRAGEGKVGEVGLSSWQQNLQGLQRLTSNPKLQASVVCKGNIALSCLDAGLKAAVAGQIGCSLAWSPVLLGTPAAAPRTTIA